MTDLEQLGLNWANGKITLPEMLQEAFDQGFDEGYGVGVREHRG